MKTKLEFEEKHHIIEVDGVEYEIPQRTPAIERKLMEHNEKVTEKTEYEGNMELLSILFGKTNAKKMFPRKDSINLDKLAKCVKMSLAAYRAELNTIISGGDSVDNKELKQLMKQIETTTRATVDALRETNARGKNSKGK